MSFLRVSLVCAICSTIALSLSLSLCGATVVWQFCNPQQNNNHNNGYFAPVVAHKICGVVCEAWLYAAALRGICVEFVLVVVLWCLAKVGSRVKKSRFGALPPPPPPPRTDPQAKQNKLTITTSAAHPNATLAAHIMNELFRTEGMYLESLELLRLGYRDALLGNLTCDDKTVHTIFPNLDAIHTIHVDLLAEMAKIFQVARSSTTDTVGDLQVGAGSVHVLMIRLGNLFAQRAPIFQHYSVFVKALDDERNTRTQLQQNPGLRSVFDSALADPRSAGRNFESVIVMPLQRILKYSLLMTELLKCAATDEEKHCLENAVSQLKSVSDKLNTSHRNSDARATLRKWAEKLNEYQRLFGERRFVTQEFECNIVIQGKIGKKIKPGNVVVCNDLVFVVTKEKLVELFYPYSVTTTAIKKGTSVRIESSSAVVTVVLENVDLFMSCLQESGITLQTIA